MTSYDLVRSREISSCVNRSILAHVGDQVWGVGEALYGLSYDAPLSQLWETPPSLSSLLRRSPISGAGLKVTLLIGGVRPLQEEAWQSRAGHYRVEDGHRGPWGCVVAQDGK